MTTFELIESGFRIVAILLPSEVSPEQCRVLYKLLARRPESTVEARLDMDLSKRWNLWGVMCDPNWATEQKKLKPMFRPHGVTLAFVEQGGPHD